MALSKKGLRKIVVDGKEYLWKISRNSLAREDGLGCVIQFVGESDNILIVDNLEIHSLSIVSKYIIIPSYVAEAIRQATKQGWQPEQKSPPFKFEFSIEEFYEKAGESSVI